MPRVTGEGKRYRSEGEGRREGEAGEGGERWTFRSIVGALCMHATS